MNFKISQRKAFLNGRKEAGNRLTIGFAGIADLRSFIAIEYIEGMMKAAADYDINFINMGAAVKYSLFDDINFINHYMKNFRFMKSPFIDGLITWASSLQEFLDRQTVINTFNQLKPLPMVDIGHIDIPGVTCLRIDSESSIKMMMDHLVNVHGYTKFGFMGADVSAPHWKRLETYKNELKAHGIKEIENSVYMAKSMNPSSLAAEVEKLIQDHNPKEKKEIEVIVTTTDIIAAEIISQFEKNGINVPQDIAVTGFNNWYDGITAKAPVTTISLEYFKRGYMAVELLIDRIMEPALPVETIRVKTSLIIRQSCGCFEENVQRAGKKLNLDDTEVEQYDSEEQLRQRLISSMMMIFKTESSASIERLTDAFFEDLYQVRERSRMMEWFQNYLQEYRYSADFDIERLENIVTDVRGVLIPVIKNETVETVLRVDGIFHQMRNLIAIYSKYEMMTARENPYRMNNISKSAVDLSDAENLEQVTELLKVQLSEMKISRAIMALSDSMSYGFGEADISFVYPEEEKTVLKKMPYKVHDPAEFPKEFFPQDKRFSFMLEVLHHSDRYFGYVFLEMKSVNIAIYDVIRLLLSNALYSVRNRGTRVIENIGRSSRPDEIEKLIQNGQIDYAKRKRVTVTQITDYLMAHICDKTDLDQMAVDFMVSRSYLTKKTKEVTGCSVQELHEKMKIEHAKKMLLSENYTIARITELLGFANQNYFSFVFKKNTGLSPKFWVQRNK